MTLCGKEAARVVPNGHLHIGVDEFTARKCGRLACRMAKDELAGHRPAVIPKNDLKEFHQRRKRRMRSGLSVVLLGAGGAVS